MPALTDRGVRRDTAKVFRGIDATDLVEVSAGLRDFAKPVVLMWGDSDRFFPIDLAVGLRDAFPDARLVEIPGGRLFVPLDEPQRVAEGIQSALQSGGGGRRR